MGFMCFESPPRILLVDLEVCSLILKPAVPPPDCTSLYYG